MKKCLYLVVLLSPCLRQFRCNTNGRKTLQLAKRLIILLKVRQTIPDYYTNKISLSDLQKNLKEKKEETVYFYQTSCVHCQKLSPVLVPMAKDLNVDMKVMDIEKLDAPWDEYKIQGTPTIIHFKDGKEVSRISGEQPKDKLKEWLEQTKSNEKRKLLLHMKWV